MTNLTPAFTISFIFSVYSERGEAGGEGMGVKRSTETDRRTGYRQDGGEAVVGCPPAAGTAVTVCILLSLGEDGYCRMYRKM